jgi:hypothetical protein
VAGRKRGKASASHIDRKGLRDDAPSCRLEITSPERAALVVFPQQSQQERRYHGIDIDAEHVWRRA